MINKLRSVFITLLLVLPAVYSKGQGKTQLPVYNLNIRIDPETGTITGKSEIKEPGDSCFILTKDMNILRVTADGKVAKYHLKPSDSSKNSFVLIVDGHIAETIVIEYTGTILSESYPKIISDLNIINSHLVELSDHIQWYPHMKGISNCRYVLDVDVPEGYVTVTNLILKKQKSGNNRVVTTWESAGPISNITLVSIPDLLKSAVSRNGKTVEVYYSKLPVNYVDSMKNDLLRVMELLESRYGSPGSRSLVRIVYSPRSAGGYSRTPMILVSENYALEQRNQKFGFARDFQLNAHEIAHYWSFADTHTPEDWMNEGLAEFSALLMSEEIIGRVFSNLLLDEYNEIVRSSLTSFSIAETPAESNDRTVNRYYKPTLLMNDLRKQFGDNKMNSFIKSVYLRFSRSEKATTELFLGEVKKSFGNETEKSISEALFRKVQLNRNDEMNVVYSQSDTIFLGTWEGPLTQFGSTVRFVLNLRLTDGKLEPSLDSPDQSVTGIPLSDLVIAGDSISFKIGVAAASYKGLLDHKSMSVKGEFYQRGGTYSLNLKRQRSE